MTTPDAASLKTVPSADDLGQQIAALRADVSKLVTTLSDNVSEGIGKAGRQIERSGRDARTTATNTVLEHPLAAVGIAVGFGLLIGMIARKS